MQGSRWATWTAISVPAMRRGWARSTLPITLGLKPRHIDSTDCGGSSYILHVGHAAAAIATGKCTVALITLAGRPRTEANFGAAMRASAAASPDYQFEHPYAPTTANMYAMCAMRHMHEFKTTSEQLAWIKVAASYHAQWNPHAMLPEVVTVADVLASPMIADPLHRLDCCVISDGGGAIIVTAPEIARSLAQPRVRVLGAGEAPKHQMGGHVDLSFTAAALVGCRRPSPRPASRLPTSSTPRSTTASPSPC